MPSTKKTKSLTKTLSAYDDDDGDDKDDDKQNHLKIPSTSRQSG